MAAVCVSDIGHGSLLAFFVVSTKFAGNNRVIKVLVESFCRLSTFKVEHWRYVSCVRVFTFPELLLARPSNYSVERKY